MSTKDTVTSSDTLTGRVKWFNNKAGYGFITVTVGDRSGSDIFVHHSGINVSNQQYKYLVQGEYVDFVLEKPESGNHEFHAINVNGISNGKLMCETRRDFKLARNAYVNKSSDEPESSSPRTGRQDVSSPLSSRPDSYSSRQMSMESSSVPPRSRGEGPRETQQDKKEWTTVARGKPAPESSTVKPAAGRGRGRPARSSVNSVDAK